MRNGNWRLSLCYFPVKGCNSEYMSWTLLIRLHLTINKTSLHVIALLSQVVALLDDVFSTSGGVKRTCEEETLRPATAKAKCVIDVWRHWINRLHRLHCTLCFPLLWDGMAACHMTILLLNQSKVDFSLIRGLRK